MITTSNSMPLENILEPKPIGHLLEQENGEAKYNFFIPAYQRGYRWEKEQVVDLLDDFLEFITTKKTTEEKYCLQPIVVNKLSSGKYEVLDGQQRLTTIFILLSRLKETNTDIELFRLEYETRPDSSKFLNTQLKNGINEENPDYFYISTAYETIDKWLLETKNKTPNISTKLFDILAESVEFIWYQITNAIEPIDIFTRINIGKIPLTNAELTKAVFLSKNNLSIGAIENENQFSKQVLVQKQNKIALQWDIIEKQLHDPKFWGFIYNGTKEYDTRIDYLLEVYTGNELSSLNRYPAFSFFYKKVKDARKDPSIINEMTDSNTSFMENEWSKLYMHYEILFEWYSDKTYNHLIGYLISQKHSISTLVSEFKELDRKSFHLKLKKHIKSKLKYDKVEKLRYKPNNLVIYRILLFHNVFNSLNNDDSSSHFPYERYFGKKWTLEHIFAQNSEDLREDQYSNWLEDQISFFENQKEDYDALEIAKIIKFLISKNQNNTRIEKDEFQACFGRASTYVTRLINDIDNEQIISSKETNYLTVDEFDWINDDDSLANLALLDVSVNSAIGNALFEVKRNMILRKDKEGHFVPLETKKVFLKYYTDNPNHLAYWTFNDRFAYVKNIQKSLTYLNL